LFNEISISPSVSFMAAGTLPLEIFNRIVQHIRPSELPPLCRISKAFQRVAERRLYGYLILGDANTAYRACQALAAHDGARGTYVKRFWFWIDLRRTVSRGELPQHFWLTVDKALSTMTELKDLLIHDPAETTTWILHPDHIKFQLTSAKFRLAWDRTMVAFLMGQTQLKHLQTSDAPDLSQVESMPAGYLPALETYEGPLLVAAELLACSRVTHMRTTIDEEVVPLLPQFIEGAIVCDTPLRSLQLGVVPEPLLADTFAALTFAPKWCARLRYLGVFSMPWIDRNVIHRHLMKLHNLQSIAFDVSHWEPAPIEVTQRAFALEMHMYCPSLRRVAFWFGQQVNLWVYHQEVWTPTGLHLATHVEEQLWLSV